MNTHQLRLIGGIARVRELPLGRIERAGKTFYAYAVQSNAGGVTFYALFLEFEDIVHA